MIINSYFAGWLDDVFYLDTVEGFRELLAQEPVPELIYYVKRNSADVVCTFETSNDPNVPGWHLHNEKTDMHIVAGSEYFRNMDDESFEFLLEEMGVAL